jgi:hypothetical protein
LRYKQESFNLVLADVAMRPILQREDAIMRKKTTPGRRGTDMAFTPIIPVKVESLLADINLKMGGIEKSVGEIKDAMHQKADKSDLDKLESQFVNMQRNGSDVAKRVYEAETEIRKKVDKLEREAVSRSAVEDNNRRIDNQERNSRWQWAFIVVGMLTVMAETAALFLRH